MSAFRDYLAGAATLLDVGGTRRIVPQGGSEEAWRDISSEWTRLYVSHGLSQEGHCPRGGPSDDNPDASAKYLDLDDEYRDLDDEDIFDRAFSRQMHMASSQIHTSHASLLGGLALPLLSVAAGVAALVSMPAPPWLPVSILDPSVRYFVLPASVLLVLIALIARIADHYYERRLSQMRSRCRLEALRAMQVALTQERKRREARGDKRGDTDSSA